MSWCQSPRVLSRLQSQDTPATTPGDRGYIGVLAVICGDGTCRIMLLPELENQRRDVLDTPVLFSRSLSCFELRVPPTSSTSSHRRCDLTSVAWQGNDHKESTKIKNCNVRIACGLSDGGILVWDLPFDQLVDGAKCQYPVPSFQIYDLSLPQSALASSCAVNSVQFCPYNPNILLSGGYDNTVKVQRQYHCY